MPAFPKPKKAELLFEDRRLYACLAAHPFAKHHVIVVWKKDVPDLRELSRADFDHLMRAVDAVRDAMLAFFKVRKVYLFYMDEYRHVHWHLLPRFKKTGFGIVTGRGRVAADLSVAPGLRAAIATAMRPKRRH